MTAAVRRHALRLTRADESEVYLIDHARNQMVADSSLSDPYNLGWLRRDRSAATAVDPLYLAAETAQTAQMKRVEARPSPSERPLAQSGLRPV